MRLHQSTVVELIDVSFTQHPLKYLMQDIEVRALYFEAVKDGVLLLRVFLPVSFFSSYLMSSNSSLKYNKVPFYKPLLRINLLIFTSL